MDSQPCRVINRELLPLLCHVKSKMADIVCCEARDLVFVDNVTTGVNTVLKSQRLTSGDVILTLSLGYGNR